MNIAGYTLLQSGKIHEAIEVFKLNVEAYPLSSNVYDSLGEAYMANGDKQLAIKNYEKSVEIDPMNLGGIERLKNLRGE
jgi:tetratricopeptide (TPR) repeat protein